MMRDTDGQGGAILAEWRVHWRTGAATMLGMGLGVSVLPNLSSLFVEPLERAFGWSRGQIGLAQSAALISAVAAPFVGRWIDRYGVRRFIAAGFVVMGLGYAGLSLMTGPIALFYLLFAILAVGGLPTGGLGYSRVISATFVRSRGFSLAVARSGLAISTAIMPSVLFATMAVAGWRAGYALLSALILLLALPVSWRWLRAGSSGDGGGHEAAPMVRWRTLLRNRRVVTVAVAAALAYTPLLAIVSQLQPLLTSQAISPLTAARLVGLLGASSFVGAIVTGTLVDRFWAPAIAFVMLAAAAVGAVMLNHVDGDTTFAVAAILLLGLAQGAELDIVSFVVARYFGVRVFSSIYGLSVLAIAAGSAAGMSLIGQVYDRTGDYSFALSLAAVAFLLSGVAYLSLGRYPAEETATHDR